MFDGCPSRWVLNCLAILLVFFRSLDIDGCYQLPMYYAIITVGRIVEHYYFKWDAVMLSKPLIYVEHCWNYFEHCSNPKVTNGKRKKKNQVSFWVLMRNNRIKKQQLDQMNQFLIKTNQMNSILLKIILKISNLWNIFDSLPPGDRKPFDQLFLFCRHICTMYGFLLAVLFISAL